METTGGPVYAAGRGTVVDEAGTVFVEETTKEVDWIVAEEVDWVVAEEVGWIVAEEVDWIVDVIKVVLLCVETTEVETTLVDETAGCPDPGMAYNSRRVLPPQYSSRFPGQ